MAYQHCVVCHQPGGIAPVNLVDYGQAAALSKIIKDQVTSRIMPPWGADNTGACNTYQNARWLSEDEIALFAAWADAGAPEGDPAHAPAMPEPLAGLAKVSATLDIGADYTPNDIENDDYRCFVVDPGLTQDMYLTGYQVKPGDSRVVHHVILYSLDSAAAQQAVEDLDAAEAGPGYTCFGGPGSSDSRFIGGWAPGTPATEYPEGTGVQLTAGRKVVIQIHYNLLAGAWTDHTTMDVTLEPSVPFPATITPIYDAGIVLPPGQSYVTGTSSVGNPAPVPVRVHGVFPHMHQLGVDLTVTATRGSEDICMVDVPRWDFNWQQFYLYATAGDDLAGRRDRPSSAATTPRAAAAPPPGATEPRTRCASTSSTSASNSAHTGASVSRAPDGARARETFASGRYWPFDQLLLGVFATPPHRLRRRGPTPKPLRVCTNRCFGRTAITR